MQIPATPAKELRKPLLLCGTVTEDEMKTKTLITLLTIVAAVSASSSPYEEQLSIHTLAPRNRGAGIHVADALLSDWEGDHWVSLDADLDKVSLSWTTDAEHITFQVRKQREGMSVAILYPNRMMQPCTANRTLG